MALRRLTFAVALMFLASMTASEWARCMADTTSAHAAQMACCKSGHDKCAMHRTAADCCKAEGQRHQQVTFATHETSSSVSHPPVVITALDVAVTPALVRFWHSTSHRTVLKGPDPPPYLLGSAFLV